MGLVKFAIQPLYLWKVLRLSWYVAANSLWEVALIQFNPHPNWFRNLNKQKTEAASTVLSATTSASSDGFYCWPCAHSFQAFVWADLTPWPLQKCKPETKHLPCFHLSEFNQLREGRSECQGSSKERSSSQAGERKGRKRGGHEGPGEWDGDLVPSALGSGSAWVFLFVLFVCFPSVAFKQF